MIWDLETMLLKPNLGTNIMNRAIKLGEELWANDNCFLEQK